MKKVLLILLLLTTLHLSAWAQYGTIAFLAGGDGSTCTGTGFSGDGGAALSSSVCFAHPRTLCTDTAGNLYLFDAGFSVVRKIYRASGIIMTVAGNGMPGHSGDGGPATSASIEGGLSDNMMCTDLAGNLYIAEHGGYIRKVDHSTGIITTIAGNGTTTHSGDGGPATSAGFHDLMSIYVDDSGAIFAGERLRIRRIDPSTGIINTVVGSGTYGWDGDGGSALSAAMTDPFAITKDRHNNLYFIDYGKIRKVSSSGIISTFASADSVDNYCEGGSALACHMLPLRIGVDTADNAYVSFIDEALPTYRGVKKIDASTGTIRTLRILSDDIDSRMLCFFDRNGGIYYFKNNHIIKRTNVPPAVDELIVTDSLPLVCATPVDVYMGVRGSLSYPVSSFGSLSVVAASDDARFSLNEISGSLTYTTVGDTSYFGHRFGAYRMPIPGDYDGQYTISMGDGYSSLCKVRRHAGTCASGITGVHITSVIDTISTGPCVFPSIVDYTITGYMTGSPIPGDSAFIFIYSGAYGGYLSQVRVVPLIASGSVYTFSTHTAIEYYSSDIARPYVIVKTSMGHFQDSVLADSNIIQPDCIGYTRALYTTVRDTSSSGSGCSVPYQDKFSFSGKAVDSAMVDTQVKLHLYYGDGGDTTIYAPIVHDRHGTYAYSTQISGRYFEHIYSLPGTYSAFFTDTSSRYSGTTYPVTFATGSGINIGTSCASVMGVLYRDDNLNCLFDSGEIALSSWPYALVNHATGDTTYGWTDSGGAYAKTLASGYSYTIYVDPVAYLSARPWEATLRPSCPSSGAATFTVSGTSLNRSFAFQCATPTNIDMSARGWSWGFMPGDTGVIAVWAGNSWSYSCDTLHSTVTLVLDTLLTYVGMTTGPAPTISGDTLRWNFSTGVGMLEFEGLVRVWCDTFATVFDTVHSRLYVSPTSIADSALANNSYDWRSPVRAAYDPNEKHVAPQGFGTNGYIPNGTELSYIVHFQNTGSAPARNVTIIDSLSEYLDISTLQIIGSSAPVLIYHDGGNVVKFRFNNIYLPDSSSNPEGSKGYVSFTISPHDGLAPLTQISGRAGIVFDWNVPIYTNTVVNTIEDTLGSINGPDTVCVGSTITLAHHIPGGSWHCSNTHATISATGVVTGVTEGIDTVYYTAYGRHLLHKIIYIGAAPALATISGADSVCVGSATTLSASVASGTWSVVSGVAATIAASGILHAVAAGTDTVLYTTVSTCGSRVAAFPVTIISVPSAGTLSGPFSVCAGASITLSASAAGGTWSTPDAARITVSASGTVTAISAGPADVYYTLSNMCGTDTASHALTVNPLPDAGTIIVPDTMCVGDADTLWASVYGGVWTSSHLSVLFITGSTYPIAYAGGPGTVTVRYRVTNSCGADTATAVVAVLSLPHAGVITGPDSLCVGSTILLTDTTIGGVWSAGGSSVATVSAGGLVTGLSSGVAFISYSMFAVCGTDTATHIVTVLPLPSAGTITGPDSLCTGSSVLFADTATGGVWSVGSSSVATITTAGLVTGLSSGSASVHYTITGVCGIDTATHVVSVLPLPLAGTLAVTHDTLCPGDTAFASSSSAGGLWGTSSSSVTVAASSGMVVATSAGAATLTYVVTNDCGADTAHYPVFVRDMADCTADITEAHNAKEIGIAVYPNPANGSFVVSIPRHQGDVSITVTNVTGQKVAELTSAGTEAAQIPVNISHVAAGMYIVSVEMDGITYRVRVVTIN